MDICMPYDPFSELKSDLLRPTEHLARLTSKSGQPVHSKLSIKTG